jgi:hypothetical protein
MRKGLLYGMVLAISTLVVAVVFAQTYPTGMVSYWKFEESGGTIAFDSVGSNNGTLVNGPVWTTGIVGGALSFDGVDDHVDVPTSPSLDFRGTDKLTVVAWVNDVNGWPASGVQRIVSQDGPSGGNNHFILYTNGNKLGFDISTVSWHSTSGSTSLQNNIWHHVALVYDGSTLQGYLDGTLDANISLIGNIGQGQILEAVVIGAKRGNTQKFDGLIDEVSILNRALSAEEIQQLYQNGLKGQGYELGDENKGHGNDPDGIDRDNPGRGCEKKSEKGNKKRCPN